MSKSGSSTIGRYSLEVDLVDRVFGVTTARSEEEWDRHDASEHTYDYSRTIDWVVDDLVSGDVIINTVGSSAVRRTMEHNLDRHAFGNKTSISVDGGPISITGAARVEGTGDGFVQHNDIGTVTTRKTTPAVEATEWTDGAPEKWKQEIVNEHRNARDSFDYIETRNFDFATGLTSGGLGHEGFVTNRVIGSIDQASSRDNSDYDPSRTPNRIDSTVIEIFPDDPTSYDESVDYHAGYYSEISFTQGFSGAGPRPIMLVSISVSGGEPTEGPTALQEKFGQISESVGQAIGEAAIATSQWVIDKIGVSRQHNRLISHRWN